MKKILLSIDPSVNNLGCAVFRKKTRKLLSAELLHPPKDCEALEDKSFALYCQIRDQIKKHAVTEIVIETPEHWNVGGYMSRESGAIYKLTFIVGMLYSLRWSFPIVPVTPRGWKGQLPKDVTKNRLRRFYESYYTKKEWARLDNNIADAIGIGHWRLYGRV